MEYKLEVIAFNIESCLTIDSSGAQRIELCDNPGEGGTTPSYGFIKTAREKVSVDLFPIIRPRGGDFLYTDEEFEIMKKDVLFCRDLGCNGVVLGLLLADGQIDTTRTSELVELAHPMEVTFHRAFDHCRDPFEGMEEIIRAGCTRILTSGQQQTAMEGLTLISDLVKEAKGRIIIMPGSGVRPHNIKMLAQESGAVEFHSSARTLSKSKMEYINPAFSQEALDYTTVTRSDIEDMLIELKSI